MNAPRQGWRRIARALRWALHPRVVLPVIIVAALAAALSALSDARVALHDVLNFPPALLALYLAAMLAYEAVRTGQWLLWLRVLGVQAPLRVRAFAFLAGEGGQLLPAGNYLRTYLLRQAAGTPYSPAMAATTATLWLEDLLALVAVIVLGVTGWSWLRPAASGVLLAIVVIAALIYVLLRGARRSARLRAWISSRMARFPRLRPLVAEGESLREAVRLLGRPHVLLAQAVLGAGYVALGAGAFFVILQGLGQHQLTFIQGLSVYAFSLAVGLLAPLPMDLGVIEASGVGALVAYGVDPGVAVAAMLVQRALSSGVAILVAGSATAVCRRESRAAFAGMQRSSPTVQNVEASLDGDRDTDYEADFDTDYEADWTREHAGELSS